MSQWHSPETDRLFEAIAALKNKEECYLFFEDVCTVKEILDIAQRFEAAKMLDAGTSYALVSQKTGMSTATICRVNKCLEYGNGGYRLAIDRMKETEENGKKAAQ